MISDEFEDKPDAAIEALKAELSSGRHVRRRRVLRGAHMCVPGPIRVLTGKEELPGGKEMQKFIEKNPLGRPLDMNTITRLPAASVPSRHIDDLPPLSKDETDELKDFKEQWFKAGRAHKQDTPKLKEVEMEGIMIMCSSYPIHNKDGSLKESHRRYMLSDDYKNVTEPYKAGMDRVEEMMVAQDRAEEETTTGATSTPCPPAVKHGEWDSPWGHYSGPVYEAGPWSSEPSPFPLSEVEQARAEILSEALIDCRDTFPATTPIVADTDVTTINARILSQPCMCLRLCCTLRSKHGLDCRSHKTPANPKSDCVKILASREKEEGLPKTRPRHQHQHQHQHHRHAQGDSHGNGAHILRDVHAYSPWKTDPKTGKRLMTDKNRGRIVIGVLCCRCRLELSLKLGTEHEVILSERRGKNGAIRGKLFPSMEGALEYTRVVFSRAWGIFQNSNVNYLRNSYLMPAKLYPDPKK